MHRKIHSRGSTKPTLGKHFCMKLWIGLTRDHVDDSVRLHHSVQMGDMMCKACLFCQVSVVGEGALKDSIIGLFRDPGRVFCYAPVRPDKTGKVYASVAMQNGPERPGR